MEFYLVIKKTEIMTFVKKGHGTENDYIKARQLRTTRFQVFSPMQRIDFGFYICVHMSVWIGVA